MKPDVVLQLIEAGVKRTQTSQTWADLGAGNGLFTYALSTLLADNSLIYAVDTNNSALNGIVVLAQVTLLRMKTDFEKDTWPTEPLHGVLMANSLHFVKDKKPFLIDLKRKLMPAGRLIIVEYEMERGNPWVPHPIGFEKMSDTLKNAGFTGIKKLKEVPSTYNGRLIYSVVAMSNNGS